MSNSLATTASIPIEKDTIKKYLCPNSSPTDQELALFIELCKSRGLNPFLKQAYLIKYGTEAATMVVAYDMLISRAEEEQNYRGHNSGVTLLSPDGEIIHTSGMVLPEHKLLGGWCEVYRENREKLRTEVNLSEYIGRKKDGTPTKMWDEKGATMIEKVAVSKAHRRAYPGTLQGMYAQEEITKEEMIYAEKPSPSSPPVITLKKIEEVQESDFDLIQTEKSQKTTQQSQKTICADCKNESVLPALLNNSIESFGKPVCLECTKIRRLSNANG